MQYSTSFCHWRSQNTHFVRRFGLGGHQPPHRTAHTCRAAQKEIWIQPSSKEALTAGLEAGVTTFVMPDDVQQASEWGRLAVFRGLTQDRPHSSRTQIILRDAQGAEVGRVHTVAGPQDLKALEAAATAAPASLGAVVVMDAVDWKAIPAENLVALLQSAPGSQLFAVAQDSAEAALMLGALQVGTAGVLLRTGSGADVRAVVAAAKAHSSGQGVDSLALAAATVTRVVPVGMGDRVCVDMATMMRPGEGLLVGSFARGLFLVHSECEESEYINSRPFRVNAGAVHAYAAAPGGRTSYLAELKAGSRALVVDPSGAARDAVVGRAKLESRPLVLVEAKDAEGVKHSVLLQNAETVKLVGLAADRSSTSQGSSGIASTSSSTEPSGSVAKHAEGLQDEARPGNRVWRAISVAVLKPGDQVLLHQPATAARHMGIPIHEFIVEQ